MPIASDIYYFAHQETHKGKLPVLLVHGAGGNHLHWPAQARRMDDFRVYALDLPGHGRSEGRGYQSIPSYSDQILNWMDSLQMNRVVFVGHSMGGGIALTMGLEHPDRVIGLGLIGTGARLRVLPELIEYAGRAETMPMVVERMIELSFSSSSDPRLVELAGSRMVDTRPSVLQGDFLACDKFDVMERISEIQAPALALCGKDDQLTPPKYSRFLADHMPDTHLEIIPQAGHMVMLEKPDEFTQHLAGFLSTLTYHPGAD